MNRQNLPEFEIHKHNDESRKNFRLRQKYILKKIVKKCSVFSFIWKLSLRFWITLRNKVVRL